MEKRRYLDLVREFMSKENIQNMVREILSKENIQNMEMLWGISIVWICTISAAEQKTFRNFTGYVIMTTTRTNSKWTKTTE